MEKRLVRHKRLGYRSVMLLRAAAFALALSFAGAAFADELDGIRAEVNAEARGSVFPGFVPGQTRAVWVWRPRSAGNATLPVLYMFDGLDGLRVALYRLKAAVDTGQVQPFMIVAPDPNPNGETRAAEYLRGFPGGSDNFRAHEEWFITQVIPWAERTQHASPDRAHRFVGGFSNGADLAVVLATRHPDLFGGALVHSPVGSSADWLEPTASTQRWVITQGTAESSGSVHRAAQIGRTMSQALERFGATNRRCIGSWAHEGPAWRDLSPGSITWLMELGDWNAMTTARERASCRNSPA